MGQKIILTFFVICGFAICSNATSINLCGKSLKKYDDVIDQLKPSIIWYTLEKAADANKENKKFIFIDIYTDWCGWCKKMDQSTFLDSAVVTYMNEHFYAVKMNAESKDPIAYKEVLYEYKMYATKGYNELAVNLLSGQMSFPSFVILSKKEVKLGTISGYKKPTEFILALKGYVEK